MARSKFSECAEKLPIYNSNGDLIEIKQPKVIMQDFRGTQLLKVDSSRTTVGIFRQHPFFRTDMEYREGFVIMLLNRANQVIGMYQVSVGSRTGTTVDPAIIAFVAVNSMATAVILCHNHPSGNVSPSEADIALTKKVRDALKLLDIQCLDHIILTQESYYSFADEGRI